MNIACVIREERRRGLNGSLTRFPCSSEREGSLGREQGGGEGRQKERAPSSYWLTQRKRRRNEGRLGYFYRHGEPDIASCVCFSGKSTISRRPQSTSQNILFYNFYRGADKVAEVSARGGRPGSEVTPVIVPRDGRSVLFQRGSRRRSHKHLCSIAWPAGTARLGCKKTITRY